MQPIRPVLIAASLLASGSLSAAEVQIAVAGNFTAPMKAIIASFEQDSGHTVKASYGSTGKLYAQIKMALPLRPCSQQIRNVHNCPRSKGWAYPARAIPIPSARWCFGPLTPTRSRMVRHC